MSLSRIVWAIIPIQWGLAITKIKSSSSPDLAGDKFLGAIDRIIEICRAATPRPWTMRWYKYENSSLSYAGLYRTADLKTPDECFDILESGQKEKENYEFIAAHNPEYVEKLLMVAKAATELVMGRTIYKDNLGKALAALEPAEDSDE